MYNNNNNKIILVTRIQSINYIYYSDVADLLHLKPLVDSQQLCLKNRRYIRSVRTLFPRNNCIN